MLSQHSNFNSVEHFKQTNVFTWIHTVFARIRSIFAHLTIGCAMRYPKIDNLRYCVIMICMLTLSDQSYIASYTLAIILSILFPFFRHEQDIVRQGIFEAIKFHGSPKWCKFVISVYLIFMDFTTLAAKCMCYIYQYILGN